MEIHRNLLLELERVESLLVSETAEVLSADFPEKVVSQEYLRVIARYLLFSGLMSKVLASPIEAIDAGMRDAHKSYVIESGLHIQLDGEEDEGFAREHVNYLFEIARELALSARESLDSPEAAESLEVAGNAEAAEPLEAAEQAEAVEHLETSEPLEVSQ